MQLLMQVLFGFNDEKKQQMLADVGLLLTRVCFGLFMLVGHGWGKLMKLGVTPVKFGDPLGIGMGTSLFLAASTEVFCSALLVVGLATRLSLLPLTFTMITAAFVVHGADPFMRKEKALLYLVVYVLLLLAGPGRYSLDHFLKERFTSRS